MRRRQLEELSQKLKEGDMALFLGTQEIYRDNESFVLCGEFVSRGCAKQEGQVLLELLSGHAKWPFKPVYLCFKRLVEFRPPVEISGRLVPVVQSCSIILHQYRPTEVYIGEKQVLAGLRKLGEKIPGMEFYSSLLARRK